MESRVMGYKEYYVVERIEGVQQADGVLLETEMVSKKKGGFPLTNDLLWAAFGIVCKSAPDAVYQKKIKVLLYSKQFVLEKPNGTVLIGTDAEKKNRDKVLHFINTP